MTAQEKALARDQETRRRLAEYEADKQARRIRLGLEQHPERDLFEVTGWAREAVTVAEALAADLDDAEVSRLVAAQANATVALGNLLARRRRAYAEAAS